MGSGTGQHDDSESISFSKPKSLPEDFPYISSSFSNHLEDKSEHKLLKLWEEYCFYCKSSQLFMTKSDQ